MTIPRAEAGLAQRRGGRPKREAGRQLAATHVVRPSMPRRGVRGDEGENDVGLSSARPRCDDVARTARASACRWREDSRPG